MIWAIAIGLALVFLYMLSLDKRVNALSVHGNQSREENEESGPLELYVWLKTEALFKHPTYADYYERALKKFEQNMDLWKKADHPLAEHSIFRLIYLKEGVLWSDAQKTFIKKFAIQGKLIALDDPDEAEAGREPFLSLRIDDGMLQLHWIHDEFLKKRVILISQFPLYVFQPFPSWLRGPETWEIVERIAAARAKGDEAGMFETMVNAIRPYGFKWCFSDRDASVDLFEKEYVYDPNEGYLAFTDPWMRVKYKEWSLSGMSLNPSAQEKHAAILSGLGKVEVWD